MGSATRPVRTPTVSPSPPLPVPPWWETWPAPRTGSPSPAPPPARPAAASRQLAVSLRTASRGFVAQSSALSPTTRLTGAPPHTAPSTASSGPSPSGSTWTRTRSEMAARQPTGASASVMSSSPASVDFISPETSHLSPLTGNNLSPSSAPLCSPLIGNTLVDT